MALANFSVPAITRSTLAGGDMLYKLAGAAGINGWSRLALGATNMLLGSNGSIPTWTTIVANLAAVFGSVNGTLLMPQGGAWSGLTPGALHTALVGNGVSSAPSWVSHFGVGSFSGTVGNTNPAGTFPFTPSSMIVISWDTVNSAMSIGFHTAAGQTSALLATGVSVTTGQIMGGGAGANTWACTLAATPVWSRTGTGTHTTWYLAIGFE